MKRYLANLINHVRRLLTGDLAALAETGIILTAQLHIDRLKQLNDISSLGEVEFRAFSQWGEDGIIQYLINRVPIENKSFVEFGVETISRPIPASC